MAEVTYEFSKASFLVSRYTDPSEILDFCRDNDIPEEEYYEFSRSFVEVDGDMIGFKVTNWHDLIELAATLDGCAAFEEAPYLAYCHDLGAVGTYSDFDSAFRGEYPTKEAFARELCEDCYAMGKLPDLLLTNISWEGVVADLEHDYTFLEDPEGGVFVFCYA